VGIKILCFKNIFVYLKLCIWIYNWLRLRIWRARRTAIKAARSLETAYGL